MQPTKIILIGYRGTGKTTVARLLAEALGCDWVDADDEVENRARKSIAEIFDESGEPGFRDIEARVVADLCRREYSVLALGGGAVLRQENRKAIREAGGPVVWLTAGPQAIQDRLAADTTTTSRRPNLTVGGLAEVEQLLESRLPLYGECATLVVDTEGKTPQWIAEEILDRLLS